MLVAFDLDGLICNPISSTVATHEVKDRVPVAEVVEFIRELNSKGHDIVIYSTRDGSLMLETEAWLDKNRIPYHHVVYGLPKRNFHFSVSAGKFTNKEEAHKLVALNGGGTNNG